MNKPFVYVGLYLTGNNGSPWVIEDYIDEETGEYVSIGTQAAAMLDRHEDIHYMEHGGVGETWETIIPYHAIMRAVVAKTPAEYVKPEDSYCKPVESPFSPTGGGRTISLTRISEEFASLDEEELIFTNMIPYLLDEGIEVKFLGEVVTGIEHTTESYDEIYTITTEQGTHVVYTSVSGDYDVFYPTVDGETVDKVSVTVATKQYYLLATDNYRVKIFDGLYNAGTEVVCDDDYTSYYHPAMVSDDTSGTIVDHKLPALTEDALYRLS